MAETRSATCSIECNATDAPDAIEKTRAEAVERLGGKNVVAVSAGPRSVTWRREWKEAPPKAPQAAAAKPQAAAKSKMAETRPADCYIRCAALDDASAIAMTRAGAEEKLGGKDITVVSAHRNGVTWRREFADAPAPQKSAAPKKPTKPTKPKKKRAKR